MSCANNYNNSQLNVCLVPVELRGLTQEEQSLQLITNAKYRNMFMDFLQIRKKCS